MVLFWRLGDVLRLANMVFSERTGLPKLRQMAAYAVGAAHTCRRLLLARELGGSDAAGGGGDGTCLNLGAVPCDTCASRSGNTSTTLGKHPFTLIEHSSLISNI